MTTISHGGDINGVVELISSMSPKNQKLKVPEKIIDFSSNLNPFGPPQSVMEKLNEYICKVSKYPSVNELDRAKSTVAEFAKAFAPNILLFNGSSEIIQFLALVYRPQKVTIFQPTFIEYELAANSVGSSIFNINTLQISNADDLINSFEFDNKKVPSDMVFICNPNNPTSALINKESLIHLIKKYPQTLFVVDEAFIDFTDKGRDINSIAGEAHRLKNVIVLGSFTKILTVPGVRIGFLVSSREIADWLEKFRYSWPINIFAIEAIFAGLSDRSFIHESINKINRLKDSLYKDLALLESFKPVYYPNANFVLLEISSNIYKKLSSGPLPVSMLIQKILLEKGVLVRDCSNFQFLNDRYIRVSVNKEEENKILISALYQLSTEIFK